MKPAGDDTFDPGTQRGSLWVCFECFAKLLLGGRKEEVPCK